MFLVNDILFGEIKQFQVKVNSGLSLKHVLFYHIWELWPFWSNDLKQFKRILHMNLSLNNQVISAKKMFRLVYGSQNEWPWMKGHRSA